MLKARLTDIHKEYLKVAGNQVAHRALTYYHQQTDDKQSLLANQDTEPLNHSITKTALNSYHQSLNQRLNHINSIEDNDTKQVFLKQNDKNGYQTYLQHYHKNIQTKIEDDMHTINDLHRHNMLKPKNSLDMSAGLSDLSQLNNTNPLEH